MPVRSLNSPVLKWPDRRTVEEAVRRWAAELGRTREELLRAAYFGSYARGDWGVGSDVDLILIVAREDAPFERRGVSWHATDLPVPADVLVYTEQEWAALLENSPFAQRANREAVWVFNRQPALPPDPSQ